MTKRKRRGALSRLQGQAFEWMIEPIAARSGIQVVRIPDGCKTIKILGKLKVVRTKSPFDFVLAKDRKSVFLDTKTTTGNKFGKIPARSIHQLHELLKLESQGFIAGFLVYFRSQGIFTFYKASEVRDIQNKRPLRPTDGMVVGLEDQLDLGEFYK